MSLLMNRRDRRRAAAEAHLQTGVPKDAVTDTLKEGMDAVLVEHEANEAVYKVTTPEERAKIDEAVAMEVKAIVARIVQHVGAEKVDATISTRLKAFLRSGDFIDATTRNVLKQYVELFIEEEIEKIDAVLEARVKAVLEERLEATVQQIVQTAVQSAVGDVKRRLGIGG